MFWAFKNSPHNIDGFCWFYAFWIFIYFFFRPMIFSFFFFREKVLKYYLPPMPIYRSMCSPNNNSTFNCKFSNDNTPHKYIHIFHVTQFGQCSLECVFAFRLQFSTRMRIDSNSCLYCASQRTWPTSFNWKSLSKYWYKMRRYEKKTQFNQPCLPNTIDVMLCVSD